MIRTKLKRLMTKKILIVPVLAVALGAGILVGCRNDTEAAGGRESDRAAENEGVSARDGRESGGEHGGGGEGTEGAGERGPAGESGTEGAEGSASGGEEGSGAMLAPGETFDTVRGGARLVMNYDAASNSFIGTVENTTNTVLTRVRVEVHLSNGAELGPTVPVDLAPGEVVAVNLPVTAQPFTGWVPHAEAGSGEGGGEHGPGGEDTGTESGAEGRESGGEGGSAELDEAAMSSPVIFLGRSWDGVLGPLAVSARYDAATQTVHSTVTNTTNQTQCYVQAEPHLKSNTTTVGELGPDELGDLAPGQMATTSLSVADEPALAGVAFDGYVVHLEVFDCAGPGPVPHTSGEGAEGGGEGTGGEGHGSSGEGGTEGAEGSEGGGEGAGTESGTDSGSEHGGRGESGGERGGG